MNDMLEKLEAIHNRYLEVEKELSSPEAMSDMKRIQGNGKIRVR